MDVNETRETRDSRKFLGIENSVSRCRELDAAGPTIVNDGQRSLREDTCWQPAPESSRLTQ